MNTGALGTVRWRARGLGCVAATTVAVLVWLSQRQVVLQLDRLGEAEDANFIPWLTFIVQALREGTIPLWNPYVLGGLPLTMPGGWGQALYYPSMVVRLIVPLELVEALQLPLHLSVSAIFVYLFARRLGCSSVGAVAAGAVYGLSGYFWFAIEDGHAWLVQSAAYVPVAAYCFARRLQSCRVGWTLATGAALALQLLAGHAQTVFYTAVALAIWGALAPAGPDVPGGWLRVARAWIGALAVAGALAAAAYLPALLDPEPTIRGTFATVAASTRGALRPYELLGAVIPAWRLQLFGGTATLVLAGLALRFGRPDVVRPAVATAAVGLVLALGHYGVLHLLLYAIVPMFPAFRSPDRALVIYVFAVSVLAGHGLDCVGRYASADAATRRRFWWRATFVMIVVLVTTVMGVLVVAAEVTWPIISGLVAVRHDLARALAERHSADALALAYGALDGSLDPAGQVFADLVRKVRETSFPIALVGACAVLAVASRLGPRAHGVVRVALVALIVAESAQFNSLVVVREPRSFVFTEKYAADKPLLDLLRRDAGFHRVLVDTSALGRPGLDASRRAVLPNELMMHRFFDTKGSWLNSLTRYHTYVMSLVERERVAVDFTRGTRDVPDFPFYPGAYDYLFRTHDSPFVDLLNVRYLVTAGVDAGRGWQLVSQQGAGRDDVRIYRNAAAFPRAWTVRAWDVMHDEAAVLAALRRPPDFRRVAILGPVDAVPRAVNPPVDSGIDEVRIDRYTPNDIRLSVRAASDAMLVLSEVFHPWWTARVDDRATPVYRANYLFRAVPVPAGTHVVTLTFSPWPVAIGRAISVIAWSCLAVVGAVSLARRRRARAGTGRVGLQEPAPGSILGGSASR